MSSITYEEAFNKVLEQLLPVQAQQRERAEWQQITKKISQLIAKSWLPEGEDIKKTLLNGKEEEIKELLKKNGVDFPERYTPIKLFVDWNSFFGKVEEKTVGQERSLEWTIAYPPRPYYDVTDEQLRKWVDDQETSNEYPTAPYIPLTF